MFLLWLSNKKLEIPACGRCCILVVYVVVVVVVVAVVIMIVIVIVVVAAELMPTVRMSFEVKTGRNNPSCFSSPSWLLW